MYFLHLFNFRLFNFQVKFKNRRYRNRFPRVYFLGIDLEFRFRFILCSESEFRSVLRLVCINQSRFTFRIFKIYRFRVPTARNELESQSEQKINIIVLSNFQVKWKGDHQISSPNRFRQLRTSMFTCSTFLNAFKKNPDSFETPS